MRRLCFIGVACLFALALGIALFAGAPPHLLCVGAALVFALFVVAASS